MTRNKLVNIIISFLLLSLFSLFLLQEVIDIVTAVIIVIFFWNCKTNEDTTTEEVEKEDEEENKQDTPNKHPQHFENKLDVALWQFRLHIRIQGS